MKIRQRQEPAENAQVRQRPTVDVSKPEHPEEGVSPSPETGHHPRPPDNRLAVDIPLRQPSAEAQECAVESTSSELVIAPRRRRFSLPPQTTSQADPPAQDEPTPPRPVRHVGEPIIFHYYSRAQAQLFQAMYPPELPDDSYRFCKPVFSSQIDVEQLLEQNRAGADKYEEYARTELIQRRGLYELADSITAKLQKIREQIALLDESQTELRSRPNMQDRRHSRLVGHITDLKGSLKMQERQLEAELVSIAGELLRRRIEAEELVISMFEGPRRYPNRLASFPTQRPPPSPPVVKPLPPPEPLAVYEALSWTGSPRSCPTAHTITFGGHILDLTAQLKIPEWFEVMEALRSVTLLAGTKTGRYVELLNKMSRYETELGDAGAEGRDGLSPRKPWDKHFHLPDPRWPDPLQQAKGGWWKCRSDEDATAVEKACEECYPRGIITIPAPSAAVAATVAAAAAGGSSPESPQARFDYLMSNIRRCMSMVADLDKRAVTAKRHIERHDVEDMLRTRNWKLQGGFISPPGAQPPALRIREVKASRRVEDLLGWDGR